ncbi:MAG: hypothetical protein ACQEQL_05435, partial [Pseudomonadota bacterium]
MENLIRFLSKQNGNALFLILIAVALFAALSYAVTQSGRGGGDTDREQEMILLGEVHNQIAAFQQAIQRMRVINGVAPQDITGHSDPASEFFCDSGEACLFADEAGGPASGRPPPS